MCFHLNFRIQQTKITNIVGMPKRNAFVENIFQGVEVFIWDISVNVRPDGFHKIKVLPGVKVWHFDLTNFISIHFKEVG
jgi:hypothetical protein